MTHLVFFLEEPSAKEMLQGMLPKILPEQITTQYVVFEGKQDLEKRLSKKLSAWRSPDTLFVVMRDQDSGNCIAIKETLIDKCTKAGKPNTLVRIVCKELESFYLGDLKAVAQAIGPSNLESKQQSRLYRDPDKLNNAKNQLKMIAPTYQPLSGSRDIGKLLNIEENQSTSFNALVKGIRRLVDNTSNG